jgi:uncharacterized ion transporter superfamily protein YfcC
MKKYFGSKKSKRYKFNLAMTPFVLVTVIAAIAVITWIIAYSWFRIR